MASLRVLTLPTPPSGFQIKNGPAKPDTVQTSLLTPPPFIDQELMSKIQDFVAYYEGMFEKNPERVLSLCCAKLEDHPYPPDLVAECIQRFRESKKGGRA